MSKPKSKEELEVEINSIKMEKSRQAVSDIQAGCIDNLVKALEDYIYLFGDDIEMNDLLLKIYGKTCANNLDPLVVRKRLKAYSK